MHRNEKKKSFQGNNEETLLRVWALGRGKPISSLSKLLKNQFFSHFSVLIIDRYFNTNWLYFLATTAQKRPPNIANYQLGATIQNTGDAEGGAIEVDTIMEENDNNIIDNEGINRLIHDTFVVTNENVVEENKYENIQDVPLIDKAKKS